MNDYPDMYVVNDEKTKKILLDNYLKVNLLMDSLGSIYIYINPALITIIVFLSLFLLCCFVYLYKMK